MLTKETHLQFVGKHIKLGVMKNLPLMTSMTLFDHTLSGCSFLLGRAGSGKTYGCLAAISSELMHSPRGLPLILLTPEQATAQMERRLATWPGLRGGTTRARVFSFHHLAREAFLRAGGAPGQQLGDLGRVMLLRQAMLLRQGELTALGQSASQPGVAETVSKTILEFQRYGWSLADIESWVHLEILEQGEAGLTVRKLRDLAILWRDYEAALVAGHWEDPARMYEAAAAAIRKSDWLAGARVWIDGFASFTALEMTILDALLGKASHVVFALCLDPRQLWLKEIAGGGLRPRLGVERLFENIEETCHTLRERLIAGGLAEEKIKFIQLPAAGQPTRFTASPALRHLESRVLGRIHPERCPEEAWDGTGGGTTAETPELERTIEIKPDVYTSGDADVTIKSAIELLEASDRRAEVEAVARRIVTLCRRDEAPDGRPLLLWREIAVLARDLGPYEVHLREVFGAFGIAFFLDRPRSVQGHPVARSILSALAVLRAGWAGAPFLHHLKSGLCGLRDDDAIGVIENAIRATDPQGAQWIRALEGDAQLQPLWRQAAAPLRQLESDLRSQTSPRAIWAYLESVGAATRLEGWIAEAQGRGDEETVQIHEQAWEQTVAWLEDFEKLHAALPETFGPVPERAPRERIQELIDLIEAALASTQARLVPPTLNQVTVGAVDRSRTPEVKVLFVIGLSDGEFPRMWQPDAMLGDEERDRLTRDGRRLGPDTAAKRLQEHFLAYIALTRSSGRLVLSRPQLDDEGRVCDPSPYFTLAAQMFPKATARLVRRAGEGDDPALPLRPEEWALRLGNQLNHCAEGESSQTLERLAWLQERLGIDYEHEHEHEHEGKADASGNPQSAIRNPQSTAGLRLAWARLGPARTVALDPALAAAFWDDGAALPVTALENFGECPFKFFAQRMLRLGRRQEAALNVAELGTLRHDILDHLFRALRGPEGLAWGAIDLDVTDAAIDTEVRRLRSEEPWQARLEASALGRLALDEVGEDLKLFIRALRLAGGRSRFIQVASEWTFGRGGELTVVAGGRRLAIKGTIDRIDALPPGAGRASLLIDYKSGRRKVSLGRIMEGIDLQLLAYALAWRRACEAEGGAGMRIGGVYYWPLAAPVKEAEPGDGAAGEAVDERWFKDVKPSGIFDAALAEALDGEVGPGGSSLAFSFRRVKDGGLHGGGQSHWPSDGLAALLEYEERLLERWAGMIAAGKIEICPYSLGTGMACDQCDFASICRRADPVPLTVRRIANMKREEALARLGNRE